jgi:hypothetical protein
LFELVLVLIVLGIIIFLTVRSLRPAEALALQQAERLRDDLRHMQLLAMTWNEPLRLTLVAGPPAGYYVRCVSGAATPPCNGAGAVFDPGKAGPFLVELPAELALTGPSLEMDALGRPKDAGGFIAANASFTVAGGGTPRTVVVTPLTGFVTAQ